MKRVPQLDQEGTTSRLLLVRVGRRNEGTTGEKTSTAVKLIDYWFFYSFFQPKTSQKNLMSDVILFRTSVDRKET